MDQRESAGPDLTPPHVTSTRRISLPIVAAWVVAAGVLVALVISVSQHLSAGAMDHSGHSTSEVLTRAGNEPVGALFGSKLLVAWHVDAIALAILILLAAWYLTCIALLKVRSPETRWPVVRTGAFLAGIATAAYATCGAIAVFDQVLFTAHMAGHLALVMLAPALLVAGRPLRLALLSSPARRAARLEAIFKGRIVTAITCPPIALVSYTVVIVGSHLTSLMDTFMQNTWAGQLEHLLYLLAGFQFFVLIVGDEPIRWKLGAPSRWLLLALAMAVDTFTGIVLMQQREPVAMVPAPGVHVNVLTDTHTGGAIMWFGGDGLMAVVMVVLVISWLRSVDTQQAADKGWLEQARLATFAEHTGTDYDDSPDAEMRDIDDDEAARTSYNDWLAGLDKRGY